MFAFTPALGKRAFLTLAKSPSLVPVLHLPSRTASTSAAIHPSHKNSHSSHFQSHQNAQVTYRWLEEPNKWDTQVNKPESKQTPREKCLFSPLSQQFPYPWICVLMDMVMHTMWSHRSIRKQLYKDNIGFTDRDEKIQQSCGCPFISWCFTPLNWVTALLMHR